MIVIAYIQTSPFSLQVHKYKDKNAQTQKHNCNLSIYSGIFLLYTCINAQRRYKYTNTQTQIYDCYLSNEYMIANIYTRAFIVFLQLSKNCFCGKIIALMNIAKNILHGKIIAPMNIAAKMLLVPTQTHPLALHYANENM